MKKFFITILLILLLGALGTGSFYITYKYRLEQKLSEEPKEVVHKIYYASDFNKEPVSLTYYTKKMDNTKTQEEQAKELLTALQRGHENGHSPIPTLSSVNNIVYNPENKELTVDFSGAFEVMQPKIDKVKKVNLDCIVNTLTQIKKVNKIKITVDGKEKENLLGLKNNVSLVENIKKYEVVEMQEGKAPDYLKNLIYQDKTNKLEVESLPTTWGAKTMAVTNVKDTEDSLVVNYSVNSKSRDRYIVLPRKYEQEWKVTKDGLYINGVKILDKELYVGNTWQVDNYIPLLNSSKSIKSYPANVEVKEISYKEEDSKIIKEYRIQVEIEQMLTKSKTKYIETIYFRDGVGIYKKELINPNATSFSKLEYKVKESSKSK